MSGDQHATAVVNTGPFYDDDRMDPRVGFQARCKCGWVSPVMRWRVGAEWHADRHQREEAVE